LLGFPQYEKESFRLLQINYLTNRSFSRSLSLSLLKSLNYLHKKIDDFFLKLTIFKTDQRFLIA